MRYSHRLEFQELLQKAHRRAIGDDEDYSDGKLTAKAKLPFGKTVLNKFRKAIFPAAEAIRGTYGELRGYLNSQNAEALWNYLDQHEQKYIEQEINYRADGANTRNTRRARLYDDITVAEVLGEFYLHDARESRSLITRGLSDTFFCYKPSLRKPGCVVKSRMEIRFTGYHFEITDRQRASGRFEPSGEPTSEISKGFGFAIGDRLWIFLREESENQPRVFCFYDWIKANVGSVIERAFGYVLESDSKFGNHVSGFGIGLVSPDVDQNLWKSRYPNEPYDGEQQLDNFPVTQEQIDLYKVTDKICLDPIVMNYLRRFDAGLLKEPESEVPR
jgi:hypothetical protein